MEMCAGCRILFNTDNAHFLSKVSQKVGVEDVLYSPVTVDIGGDDLTLGVKTLGAHGGKKALYLLLVGLGPVTLKNSLVSSR